MPPSPVPPAPWPGVELTSAADRLAHRVSHADHAAGLVAGQGWLRGACGVTVLAVSLLSEPGRRCPACAVAVAPPPARRDRRRSHRTVRDPHRIPWRP